MTDDNKPATDDESAVDTESVETEQADSGTETEQQPKGGRLKRTFWYLVLVIIIATIAWLVIEKPYQKLDLDFSSLTEQADEPESVYDPRGDIADLSRQLDDLTEQLNGLRQAAAEESDKGATQSSDSRQQLAQLNDKVSELSQRLREQREQLSELGRQLPEQQFEQAVEWRLFEVKQTVSAAGRLLWGAQNNKAALKLLNIADRQLAGIESAEAIQIRRVLASDIARVEASVDSQSDQRVLAIAGLQQRLNDLPNRVEEKRFTDQQNGSVSVSDAANDWRTNLAANWDDFLDTFIRIQPVTGQAEPLLTATERKAMSLRMNLLLTLAQHAAVTDNGQLWRQSIDQLLPLISELKGRTEAVNDVISRLKSLRSAAIEQQKVEQLDALEALSKAVATGGLQ